MRHIGMLVSPDLGLDQSLHSSVRFLESDLICVESDLVRVESDLVCMGIIISYV